MTTIIIMPLLFQPFVDEVAWFEFIRVEMCLQIDYFCPWNRDKGIFLQFH